MKGNGLKWEAINDEAHKEMFRTIDLLTSYWALRYFLLKANFTNVGFKFFICFPNRKKTFYEVEAAE
jgi:hypothetical protein